MSARAHGDLDRGGHPVGQAHGPRGGLTAQQRRGFRVGGGKSLDGKQRIAGGVGAGELGWGELPRAALTGGEQPTRFLQARGHDARLGADALLVADSLYVAQRDDLGSVELEPLGHGCQPP